MSQNISTKQGQEKTLGGYIRIDSRTRACAKHAEWISNLVYLMINWNGFATTDVGFFMGIRVVVWMKDVEVSVIFAAPFQGPSGAFHADPGRRWKHKGKRYRDRHLQRGPGFFKPHYGTQLVVYRTHFKRRKTYVDIVKILFIVSVWLEEALIYIQQIII